MLVIFQIILFLFFGYIQIVMLLCVSVVFKLQFLIKIVKLNPCGVLFADCYFILTAVILNCDLTVGIIL